MKKFMVFPLVMFLLCGCTSLNQISPNLNNVSFVAIVKYDEQNYVCDVSLSEDNLNLVVCEPEQIKDLTLNFNKNDFSVQFKGLTYTSNVSSLPTSAVAQVLYKVFDDVQTKTVNPTDNNCEVLGNIDGCDYIFVFSPAGLPLSLKIDDINLQVEFSNVTLK